MKFNKICTIFTSFIRFCNLWNKIIYKISNAFRKKHLTGKHRENSLDGFNSKLLTFVSNLKFRLVVRDFSMNTFIDFVTAYLFRQTYKLSQCLLIPLSTYYTKACGSIFGIFETQRFVNITASLVIYFVLFVYSSQIISILHTVQS